MKIREERDADLAAIRAIVAEAFWRAEEARLVDELRAAGELSVSLVAESRGSIVAHVALSKLRSPARALALAPLAVRPAALGQGFGAALVRAALDAAAAQDARTVFVLGSPAYYGRFGFTTAAAANYASPFAGPHFMALKLGVARDRVTEDQGPVFYAPAFDRLT